MDSYCGSVERVFGVTIAVVLIAAGCATDIGKPASDTPPAPDLRVDVKWQIPLATDRTWEIDPRELGQPVVAPGGDLLVGASNGWVYRIAGHSGDILWASPVGGSIDAEAVLQDRTVFVGTDLGELVALDWRDGTETWRHETRGSVESRPTVAGGRLFVTDSEDRLYVVDAVSGERLWDFQHETPDFFTIKGGGRPLVVGDVVYTGFADGYLVAQYTDTGDEIWAVHLGDETGEFGDIDLPLFEYQDWLIATSHAGGLYAVDLQSGALQWHVDRGEVAGVELVDHHLYATTATGRVFAVDVREGQIDWEHELPGDEAGMGVTSAGPLLAVATARGPLYWLDTRTGEPVQGWAPSTGFQNAPVFGDRYGYVMSNRGYLYAFALAY